MRHFFTTALGLGIGIGRQITLNGLTNPYDIAALKVRALDYRNKSKVLRQINSDKMEKCHRYKNRTDWSIFIFTFILTFVSFYGVPTIHEQYLTEITSLKNTQAIYNIVILMILILSAFQIAFRFGEREIEHLGTVKKLTDFISDLDDILIMKALSDIQCQQYVRELNHKYESITGGLPANSDKEWLQAKKKLLNKQPNHQEATRR